MKLTQIGDFGEEDSPINNVLTCYQSSMISNKPMKYIISLTLLRVRCIVCTMQQSH